MERTVFLQQFSCERRLILDGVDIAIEILLSSIPQVSYTFRVFIFMDHL